MSSDRPVLPPSTSELAAGPTQDSKRGVGARAKRSFSSRFGTAKQVQPSPRRAAVAAAPAKAVPAPARSSAPAKTRAAHLRLTRIDPLSVMKMAFLLSIALGIVVVVAVTIVWSVLSAVGVWDNINASVQQVLGTESGQNFDVSKYIGTPRVIGFSLIASVINVVLMTALATLAAFVYNLAAALLGGVEMTWTEDR